ncbi:MAG: Crp/Fnr family transcriptional regulator [Pseudomonadota bacterium]
MTDFAEPFLLRLKRCADLGAAEEKAVRYLVRDIRRLPADQDLKAHGQATDLVHVVLDGLACRAKLLPDGRRQIVAFLIPGDPCDLQVFLLSRMDHTLFTLAPSTVAVVPRAEIEALLAEYPLLQRAFWVSTLFDEAVLREWLLNIGRRDAYERIAHLLCELFLRHKLVNRVNGQSFQLPLTQAQIADALSLSAVYVNRTLQRLRAAGVLEIGQGRVSILKPDELDAIAGFDDDYLHLNGGSVRAAPLLGHSA